MFAAYPRLCIVVLTVIACSFTATAQTIEEQAMLVYNQYKDAVITVELVIEQNFSMMGMGSESEESKIETTGTVIDATGLTVVALSATDPMGMMAGVMGDMLGEDMQMQSEITNAHILTDGAPIPAKVVLRDKDNDLAFIRPVTPPESPLPYIDLTQSAQPALLGQIVVIEKQGKVASRIHTVDIARITGIVERPRLFYLTSSQAVGAPAFSPEGKCIGVFVTRILEQNDGGSFSPLSMLSGMEDAVTVILRPASIIAEAAAQAPPVENAE